MITTTRNEPTVEIDDASVETPETSNTKKKYVVVGGGWGGWGSAKTLCQSGVDAEVILNQKKKSAEIVLQKITIS